MGLIVDQVNQLTRGGWDLIRDKEEVCTRAATSQQVQEVQRNKRYKRHKRSNKTRGAIRQEVQQEVQRDGDGSPCFQLEEDINN